MSYCPEHGVKMESVDRLDTEEEGDILVYLCPECEGYWTYFEGTYTFIEGEEG